MNFLQKTTANPTQQNAHGHHLIFFDKLTANPTQQNPR
jgi:hypothetical protein